MDIQSGGTIIVCAVSGRQTMTQDRIVALYQHRDPLIQEAGLSGLAQTESDSSSQVIKEDVVWCVENAQGLYRNWLNEAAGTEVDILFSSLCVAAGGIISLINNPAQTAIVFQRGRYEPSDGEMYDIEGGVKAYSLSVIQWSCLLLQEELQKEAFEALQCQKDARHKRITSQISLIEQELAELTMLEIEQRDMRLDTQIVSTSWIAHDDNDDDEYYYCYRKGKIN